MSVAVSVEVIKQFEDCINSLEKEIAQLEEGSCDEATLDRLGSYPIRPEFESSVGKYCSFRDVKDFLPDEGKSPAQSTEEAAEEASSAAVSTPIREKDPELAEKTTRTKEKRPVGRPRKRKVAPEQADSEQTTTPRSRSDSTSTSTSTTTPQASSPRRSKRTRRE